MVREKPALSPSDPHPQFMIGILSRILFGKIVLHVKKGDVGKKTNYY